MMSAKRKSGSGDEGAGPALECRSVTVELPHRFGRKRIIEDISFQVRSGEFLTIVGPSGTGKTTLLRVMGGLTSPASGSVLVHGKELGRPSVAIVRWHAAACSNRARFSAASRRNADGRTVCGARCHDKSVHAGRTFPGSRSDRDKLRLHYSRHRGGGLPW